MTSPAKIAASPDLAPKMLEAVWNCVAEEMARVIGEGPSGLWIRPISLNELSPEKTAVSVPNEIYEVWIHENYLQELNTP